MQRSVSIRLNADGTATVRCGRQIEHVTWIGRTHAERWDAVRYALIAMDMRLPDIEITALLDFERRRAA